MEARDNWVGRVLGVTVTGPARTGADARAVPAEAVQGDSEPASAALRAEDAMPAGEALPAQTAHPDGDARGTPLAPGPGMLAAGAASTMRNMVRDELRLRPPPGAAGSLMATFLPKV